MFNRKTALGTSSGIRLSQTHPLRAIIKGVAEFLVKDSTFAVT